MSSVPLKFSFDISAFDLSKLPVDADLLRSNPDLLSSVISDFLASQFRIIGGEANISVSGNSVSVSWIPAAGLDGLISHGIDSLKKGNYDIGVPLLRAALSRSPDDTLVLFNLGMALSDQNKLEDAIKLLERLVALEPLNAHAWNALGVAQSRRGDPAKAEQALRKAIEIDPDDGYSHRNLGSIIANKDPAKALPHLKSAAELIPDDQGAQYGYGLALCQLGQNEAADPVLLRVINLDPLSEIAERARQSRTRIAHENLRAGDKTTPRMDVVMYCVAALRHFKAHPESVQPISFEIAMLGRSGLDINDPAQKYTLKTMPGKFSGLHLLSYMYVGFKKLDPAIDSGVDFSREYAMAMQMAD